MVEQPIILICGTQRGAVRIRNGTLDTYHSFELFHAAMQHKFGGGGAFRAAPAKLFEARIIPTLGRPRSVL